MAVLAAVVLVVVVGVAVAMARDRHHAKQPHLGKLPAAKQYGDDADLMRRLERSKHVRGSQ